MSRLLAEDVRTRLIGLGERSVRKTYYSELKERMGELERFRALLNQAGDAILVLDADALAFVDANETAARLTRRPLQDLLGAAPGAVLDPGAMRALAEALEESMRRGRSGVREMSAALLRADNGSVPCDLSLLVQVFESRRYVLVSARDISRRLADQKALREREAYYEAVVEAFDGEIFICDQDCRIEFANARLLERLGRDPVGEPCHQALHGLDAMCPWCAGGLVAEERTASYEIRDKESKRWSYVVQTPIRHGDGRVSRQVMAWDVTARKQMEERLRRQALHDTLTDLASRTLCLSRVGQALDESRRMDGAPFALLQSVAARLQEAVEPGDTVARYGGDEFLILLSQSPPRRAVRTALASVGLVLVLPGESGTAQDLLQNADIAMQRAKRRGEDRPQVFTPSMREQARKRLILENDMREGLATGQFHLAFQPIVSLKGGPRLSGLEALLRWTHPERGAIGPGEFIPVAEETGRINELGRFALEQACRDMARFRAEEPRAESLTLSVNVSGRQFSGARFSERVRRALEESGLPGERLRLEVTETALMDNPELAAATLKRLKGLGVSTAVDEFGRGYSSLSYLRQLPPDLLKIDLTFVRRMLESSEDMEIVKEIINLAHNLDLAVVAEGVERREQQNLLMLLDCEYAQGSYYARPQDRDQTLQVIRDYAPAARA